ncbi:MAG: cytochrome P450 [Acidimicrobiia bacterium]
MRSTSPDLADIDLTDLDRFTHGFPHDVFTRLRRDAPVFFHEPTEHTPGGEGFWVLSRHADVTAVAADGATFSSAAAGRPTGGGTLIEDLPDGFASGVLLNMMDDPRHQRIRQLVTPAVAPRALARLEPGLRARTDAILDAVVARGTCDLVVDVAAELPLQAAAELLGVPQADRHQLFAWANANLDFADRDLGERTERSIEASAALGEYGTRLVEQKRRCPADDMMSAVVNGTIPGAGGAPEHPTDLESLMFFNLMVSAGSETTRNAIAIGLLALAGAPEAWDALRADRSLLVPATEEILRWTSVTTYNRRTATRDVEVGGRTIKAGEKVTLWWASANRDEAVFDRPFEFDVRRSPNPHVTFGHGGHFCLGANLARIEIRLVLEGLLDRVRTFEVTGEVEWTRTNKHTGLRHLPVRFLV